MSALELHLPALAVVVPLLTAPLVLLLRDRTLSWIAALAASLLAFALSAMLIGSIEGVQFVSYPVGGWAPPYGIELRVDAFSALILLIVTGASSGGLLIARDSLTSEMATERQYLFLTAWLLALAGLSGIVVTGDAFNIFVFLEISALATYILIAGGPRREALTSVFRYVVMGTIGATFYLIGIGMIYMLTGTLNLADMALRIADVSDLRPIFVAGGFITVGLALKAAIFPLHAWLPGAYANAPHAATAFIAACSTKVALYVLLRFDFFIFQGNVPNHELHFRTFVLPLAVIAMIVASVIAIYERDLKRLLAYSSIAHIGYIVFGAALATKTGLMGGILHMFNHALAKGTAFLAVACLGFGGLAISIEGLRGAARRKPLTMAAFVVAGLSLIGLPGTAGFTGKWYLVLGALDTGTLGALVAVPLLISSVLALVYVWRVVEAAYFGASAADSPEPSTGGWPEAPPLMLGVLLAGAALNVWFGLQPELPISLAERAADILMSQVPHWK